MTTCYLRMGADPLDDAQRYPSVTAAKDAYLDTARELARYDQPIEATIHIAATEYELVEYPDLVLSLGPRGGLRCERV